MLKLVILSSFLIISCFANTLEKSPLERDAEIYMTNSYRRRLFNVPNSTCNNGSTGINQCTDYLLVNWCTNNQYNCTTAGKNSSSSECLFYEAYGDSCVSSYMSFGFGLIIFLILPFCYLGVYTMNDVTTPLRVPTRILPVRKEY